MSERFSASVAGRLMACHASAHLELAIPNWEPPEVDPTKGAKGTGTKVHKIYEQVNEYTAKEMAAIARTIQYIADIRSTRRFKVLIEEKMEASWLPSKPKTTADLVLYTQDEMHILDPKNGRIPVPVIGNTQLLFYAATYGHLAPKAKGITVHILQEHIDNSGSWFIDTATLRQFMDDAIAADQAIAAGSTQFGPSDYCTFCPAYPHTRGDKGSPLCPTTMQLLYPKTELDEDAILDV